MEKYHPIRSITRDLAYELDMYDHIVEAIIKSQFMFVREEMQKGTIRPIRLLHLGCFTVCDRFAKAGGIKKYFEKHGSNKKELSK